jgi:hypothetical protein
MTTLTDAQAAFVSVTTVLADVVEINQQMAELQNMLERAQTSAAPITPAIMTAKRTILNNGVTLAADAAAALAAVQVVVTGLGG